MKKTELLFGVPLALLMLAGCSSPAYDVEVYMSPKVKEKYQIRPSVEVDIVGVSQSGEEHFQAVPVNDYFTPGNALRDGTEHATLHFSEANGAPKLLPKSDGIWKKFADGSSVKLYLLVNLPLPTDPKQKTDPRKLAIPLESSGWFGSDTRYFEISPSGLNPLKKRPEYSTEEIQTEKKEEGHEI